MHLAMGTLVLNELSITDENYKQAFLLGCIAPDMKVREKKKMGHFWDDEMYKKFGRKPDLSLFLDKYKSHLDDPYVFGYYSHLYMDLVFMESYWAKHFSYYDKNMKPNDVFDEVYYIKLDDGRVFLREEFFSSMYYYGDYDLIGPYIIDKYNLNFPDKSFHNEMVEEISRTDLDGFYDKIKSDFENQKNAKTIECDLKIFDISEINELISCTACNVSQLKKQSSYIC